MLMRLELPGLFDLQVNGFSGIDFNDPAVTADRVEEALSRMRSTGVTRCLPTLITSSFGDFAACARVIASVRSPASAGIHMEGPYLSPEDGPRGAHPREHIRPARVDDFKRRQDAASGRIVLVTLAPEADGAIALIEHLVASGVRVAIGHTAATSAQIADAVRAGATLATHLGNGCAQVLPRHPNAIWDLLADDGVHASFIADGHHLPRATLKSMIRAKGIERSILITDAVAAQPGADGRVTLPGTPYLAGSALTLDRAITNTVSYTGLRIEDVWPMASENPARYLGMQPAGTISAEWDPDTFELRHS